MLLNKEKHTRSSTQKTCLNPLESGRVVKCKLSEERQAFESLNPLESGRVVKLNNAIELREEDLRS